MSCRTSVASGLGVTARILPPSRLAAWRAAQGDVRIAAVTGTFDLLQPGNWAVLNRAAAIADRVVVILETDAWAATHCGAGRPRHETAVRAEFVAHMRGVTAVTVADDADQASDLLADLAPSTLVTAGEAGTDQAQAAVVRRFKGPVDTIPDWPACRTTAVEAAIRDGVTPLVLPPAAAACLADAVLVTDRPPPAAGVRVSVNGCFDVLHIGHLRFLAAAAALGDELVVLINDDASVQRYKGPSRPVFPLPFRLAALAAIDGVTRIEAFAADDPLDALTRWRPNLQVKGGSYEADRVRSESDCLAQWGGRIAFCPLSEGYSTTAYIRKVLA